MEKQLTLLMLGSNFSIIIQKDKEGKVFPVSCKDHLGENIILAISKVFTMVNIKVTIMFL